MRRNIIAVKTRRGEVRFVAVATIERVEAFGNYVKLYFGNERVLHRATLSDMEELLDDRFIRSHIVKRDQLRKLLSELSRYQK
jgi:DNA-binding LytR/AlgR family response regulator|tara:strand:- start:46000 stop:46248 length:249 start_codon:yes stop_codon:yes gene_type:complete